MKTQDRVLMIEQPDGIKRLHKEAEEHCLKANAVHAVIPFTSTEEHRKLFANRKNTFHELLKKSDPKIAQMADVMPMESFKVPAHLKEAERILLGNSAVSTHNLKYDEKAGEWVKDLEAIDAEIDQNQYRQYATEPYQFKRMEVSKAMADWLNSEKIHHTEARQRFEHILSFDGQRDTWSMNPRWILGREGSLI